MAQGFTHVGFTLDMFYHDQCYNNPSIATLVHGCTVSVTYGGEHSQYFEQRSFNQYSK